MGDGSQGRQLPGLFQDPGLAVPVFIPDGQKGAVLPFDGSGIPEVRALPFIIQDDLKIFYYRGLSEWSKERGFLRDTCLTAQDRFRRYLEYFRIAD